jgi:hypothetical protein
MRKVLFPLICFVSFGSSTILFASDEASVLPLDIGEHCISRANEEFCFKQVVEQDMSSRFVSTLESWEKLVQVDGLERAGFEYEIVSDSDYVLMGSTVKVLYPLDVFESGNVSSNFRDEVQVIYQKPQHCGCAHGVVGGALTGGVAGAGAGAKIGAVGGPQFAAGGAVLGFGVGAVSGALTTGATLCTPSPSVSGGSKPAGGGSKPAGGGAKGGSASTPKHTLC